MTHINHADNSIVEKLAPVEYEINFGCFDYGDGEPTKETEQAEDLIMTDVHSDLYTQETRPLSQMDLIFEKKMGKRLALFHNKPIDRTQFDKETLSK